EVDSVVRCSGSPPTRSCDRGSSPAPAGPIEGEELTRPASRRLLHREMAIEDDLLCMRHAVFPGIQEVTSGLYKGEMRIIEQRPKTEAQKIGLRNIVGIKNRDERLAGASEAGLQRSGFEACAVRALNQVDAV